MRIEKQNIPSATRSRVNQRFRNFEADIDAAKRKLKELASDRKALFGDRYKDDPNVDEQLEQRQQLLSGTDRLDRSSQRLRESQRIALETEDIGRGTLADLNQQREQIVHTRERLLESEGYVDRSVKTLRTMARRYEPSLPLFTGTVTNCVQDGYKSGDHSGNHHRVDIADYRDYLFQVSVSLDQRGSVIL